MIVVVTGEAVKLCPFVDELDRGRIELTFTGDAPELHALARRIEAYRDVRISHEGFTRALAERTGAVVRTTWTTAGLAVVVTHDPRESAA